MVVRGEIFLKNLKKNNSWLHEPNLFNGKDIEKAKFYLNLHSNSNVGQYFINVYNQFKNQGNIVILDTCNILFSISSNLMCLVLGVYGGKIPINDLDDTMIGDVIKSTQAYHENLLNLIRREGNFLISHGVFQEIKGQHYKGKMYQEIYNFQLPSIGLDKIVNNVSLSNANHLDFLDDVMTFYLINQKTHKIALDSTFQIDTIQLQKYVNTLISQKKRNKTSKTDKNILRALFLYGARNHQSLKNSETAISALSFDGDFWDMIQKIKNPKVHKELEDVVGFSFESVIERYKTHKQPLNSITLRLK